MRSIFAWFGRRWTGANKPLLVIQMIVVMVVAFSLHHCGWLRTDSAVTRGPDQSAAFDPQEFLCGLSGGPVGADRAQPSFGRRYTQAERAEARRMISAALRSFGLRPRELRYDWEANDGAYAGDAYLAEGCGGYGVNLIAELPATEMSEDWIIVGAHYDTVDASPGADDNASGVTAVLLVAEELAHLSVRLANVAFVFFDQEEIGLVGSRHFVNVLRFRDAGVRLAETHVIDMAGWDGDHDRAMEIAYCGNGFREAADALAARYRDAAGRLAQDPRGLMVGEITVHESCRSDHVSFARDRFIAIQIGEEFNGDMCPAYHEPADTCDTLDYGYLRSVAALVAAAVIEQLG